MNKYIIWDFDGTLAYRSGKWVGAILKALENDNRKRVFFPEQIRAYTKSGFPWHTPDIVNPPNRSADEWWDALYPVFEKIFREGCTLENSDAQRIAPMVREQYVNPATWDCFRDAKPVLKELSKRD